MSSIAQNETGKRRDRSRSFESKQQTLERRAIRFDKYGTDSRKAGNR